MLDRLEGLLARPWIPAHRGKSPYLWAACLGFMFWKFVYIRPTVLEVTLLALSFAAFLPMYFVAHWPIAPRVRVLLILGTCLLGVLWTPYNWSASTFFIFACGMSAGFLPQRRAYVSIALVMGLAVLASMLSEMSTAFIIPVLVVGIPVGISAVMDGQVRRARESLLRKQEEVEHMATIAERERISRDLHDLLGHTLSLITLKAELAGKLIERDVAAAALEVRDIEKSARAALSEVRSAVTGYRQTGFAHELDAARASLAAANVRLEADVAAFTLPSAAENVMSLALREAVTNIVRHAQASCCTVSLALEHGSIVLRIADDGAKLPDVEAIRRGNGLNGMQERVLALGGRLALRVERGLALELILPMRNPA